MSRSGDGKAPPKRPNSGLGPRLVRTEGAHFVIPNSRPALQYAPIVALVGLLSALGCEPPSRESKPLDDVGEWNQWRGPNRDGKALTPPEPPAGFDPAPTELWRRSVGPGFSAPVVSAGRLFLLEATRQEERLTAFNAADGGRLWDLALGPDWESAHGNGPRSTPTIAGDRVIALSSWGRLVAADAVDGAPLWEADIRQGGPDRVPDWGFAGSPWVDGDRVIVQGDGVFGFDLDDGRMLWKIGEGLESYASPGQLIFKDGSYQGLSLLESELLAWHPEDGRILWRHPWSPPLGINVADPVPLVSSQGSLADPSARVFLSSSYGQGAALLEAHPLPDDTWAIEEVWRKPSIRNVWDSSIQIGDYLYGFDESFLACQRSSDGEVLWKGRGFDRGGTLANAQGLLWILTLNGELVWVAPNPQKLDIRGRLQVVDGPTRTPPTPAGQFLWIRGRSELVALKITP